MSANKKRQKIKIKISGYEHQSVDAAAQNIAATARGSGATVSGPIPLPTQIEKLTILRSPHIDKKSRDQFEVRTHRRVIEIVDPTPATVEDLRKQNVSAGVGIELTLK